MVSSTAGLAPALTTEKEHELHLRSNEQENRRFADKHDGLHVPRRLPEGRESRLGYERMGRMQGVMANDAVQGLPAGSPSRLPGSTAEAED